MMSFLSLLLYDPKALRIVLLLLGVALLLAAYLLDRHRNKGLRKAAGPLVLLNLDKPGQSTQQQPTSPPASEDVLTTAPARPTPSFETLQSRPWAATDLLRALLVVLSLAVAAGFILIVLPQPAADRMMQDLQSRSAGIQQERLAFLYLGDEINNNEFHVRGVVRNITAEPIEQLDAAVRFYSAGGSVLETAIVRMNKETIAPDELAEFNLIYPDYKSQFASYAVEFKLRQGAFVPYKDMRGARGQHN